MGVDKIKISDSARKVTRLIEVKLVYWPKSPTSYAWVHRRLGEKVDVEEEDLARIREKHKTVNIIAEKASKPYFGPNTLRGPAYTRIPRTTIKVTGDTEDSVKKCVKDLLKLYGIPSETSGGFLSGNREKRIVESALRELEFTFFG